jgi:hypothetical protein
MGKGMAKVTVNASKIQLASQRLLEVTRKGLSEINGNDWLDCSGISKSIADKGGDRGMYYDVMTLIPDLARMGLVEYQWVWDRGRRMHYRSISTDRKFSDALNPKEKECREGIVDQNTKKKKKKKKKIKCCASPNIARLKSGRKKCKSCGKKFGKKKEVKDNE